jgi:hypothetical protein
VTTITIEPREMTRAQRAVLEQIGDTEDGARVIGWDTSVQGPLVELPAVAPKGLGFALGVQHIAISPRGKWITRERKD